MNSINDRDESERTAISDALSVHYIVMSSYAIVIVLCVALFLISIVSSDGSVLGMIIITLLPLTLFSIHLLAVKGLKKEQQWGHRTSKWLAFLLLMGFPFGTVLGVILLS